MLFPFLRDPVVNGIALDQGVNFYAAFADPLTLLDLQVMAQTQSIHPGGLIPGNLLQGIV